MYLNKKVFFSKIKYSEGKLKELNNTVEIGIATVKVTIRELIYQKLIFFRNTIFYLFSSKREDTIFFISSIFISETFLSPIFSLIFSA